jgi:hypothetical protein
MPSVFSPFFFLTIFGFASAPFKSETFLKLYIMSKITLKDLGLEEHKKTVQLFINKLKELIVLEKELNSEGFEIIIQPIKKKD